MLPTLLQVSCLLGAALVHAESPSWASLNVTVAQGLSDSDYFYSQVPVLFGTPPQSVDLTVDLSSDLLGAWSIDCVYCPGGAFDASQSSTLQKENKPWGNNLANGDYVQDIVGFDGIISVKDTEFVVLETMSTNFSSRIHNGHLGIYVNSSDTDDREKNIFTKLWDQGQLLNPVVGMRLDPLKPRMSIGALDPADYEGTINWVQMETPPPSQAFVNAVKIDGVKGYNGSFLPFGDNLIAELNTMSFNIAVPPSNPYALNENYTGPIDWINLNPTFGGFGYLCNDTSKPPPYVALTVTINGIDYQIDSKDNLLRPTSLFSAPGYCDVGISNTTAGLGGPDIVLGQPFLRSVYIAYRFPTDDCPGYYGFAFPSGANRTQTQIDQKPKATPTLSSQCLSLATPTSTPTAAAMKFGKQLNTGGSYQVYGRPGDGQVALMGVDELPKSVWNATDNSA